MSPGLLPIILQFVPHRDPISPTLRGIIVAVVVALALHIFLGFRRIRRTPDDGGSAAVTGYAMSVLLMVLLFPGHLEMGLALLAILAFGDGSATLFGMLLRGPRLPWNRAKSWSGFLAFLVMGTGMASWFYWAETWNLEATNPPVSFSTAVMLVMPAVVGAAVCESLESRINDNIRVGVVGGILLMVMLAWRPM